MDTAPGLSVPKLACRLGISPPRAHRLLDREGIPPAGGRGQGRRVDAAVAAVSLVASAPSR